MTLRLPSACNTIEAMTWYRFATPTILLLTLMASDAAMFPLLWAADDCPLYVSVEEAVDADDAEDFSEFELVGDTQTSFKIGRRAASFCVWEANEYPAGRTALCEHAARPPPRHCA